MAFNVNQLWILIMDIISEQPTIHIKFTIGDYSDALNLTQEEYVSAISFGTLEAMKMSRYNKWVESVALEATKGEKIEEPEVIQEKIDQVDQDIESLMQMKLDLSSSLEQVSKVSVKAK